MDAKGAAAAFDEHSKISARLRRFYGAECVFLLRHGKVGGIVTRDLQEYAGIWAAFVGLTGGVKKPGAEAEDRGNALLIADSVAHGLELLFVRVIHLDVAEKAKVIACTQPIKVCAQIALERFIRAGSLLEGGGIFCVTEKFDAFGIEKRGLSGKRSRLFVFVRQLARLDLAGFHVRLIERIDADHGACNRSRDFPAEKFLTERVLVLDRDTHHRLPRLFECCNRGFLLRVSVTFQAEISKKTILAIDSGRTNFFAARGNNSFALFSRCFGDKLFEPRAKIGNPRRSKDRDFVAAGFLQRSENGAENYAGIFIRRHRGTTCLHHLLRGGEKFCDVEALNRSRDHSEIRKRGITSANTRQAVKNVTKAVAFRHLLHLGARVRNRDEPLPCPRGSHGLLHALEEILLVDVRLECAAGLARHNDDCLCKIHLRFHGANLRRIGGIEYMKFRKPGNLPERQLQHFDAKAGSAHAEQKRVSESACADILGNFLKAALIG